MELTTQVVYIAVLLAFSLIASSEAVTCYNCWIPKNARCYSLLSSDGIETCTGTACTTKKIVLIGTTYVTRGCSYETKSEVGCSESSDYRSNTTNCYCRRDYCNGEHYTVRKSATPVRNSTAPVRNSGSVGIPSAWLLVVVGVLSMSAAIRN